MAFTSASIASSPNSFQLRLIQCRKQSSSSSFTSPSQLLFFRTHSRRRYHHHRIRLCVASSSSSSSSSTGKTGEESKNEKNPGNSWMENSPSGWFGGVDSNENGDSSEPKRNYGGFVKAGVAGVVLAAGVAFASVLLSKRNAPGPKQQIQMEPVTTQNELLLASDDQSDKVEQVTVDESLVRTDEGDLQNHDLDDKTGTYKVSSTSPEITDDISESKPNDSKVPETSLITAVEPASTDVDANTSLSQEDLKSKSDFDDISVETNTSDSDPSLTEYLGSPVDSKGSGEPIDTVSPEPLTESKENPSNLSSPDIPESNSSNLEMDQQTVTSDLSEIKISELPLEISSGSDGQTSSDPLDLDSHAKSKDVLETVTPTSAGEDLNLSQTLQKPGEETSHLEKLNLNENEPSLTNPTSILADPSPKEPDTSNELEKSGLFSQLPLPENSFSSAGIPAPSLVSAALQVPPGKVLVPAVVDQVQGQALAALQVLKVIEPDVQYIDLCTRRQYARWLVSSSNLLSRNSVSKVYPAMYIENVTDLAFDDIAPEDPDFASIQGLAEAGLIASKLSRGDMLDSSDGEQDPFNFSPESPLSRQDLVSWKMALDKRQLPEVERKMMNQLCGFIDIDKINPDAWPALVADISAGDQGIIALAFGYTRLFQPDKPVTNAQAAIALATGDAADIVSEELARIEAESMAEAAVEAHSALVAKVEKDVNANFRKELAMEKEKVDAIEKAAEEAKLELEKLRAEREDQDNVLKRGRAAVESEMEVLTRLRRELEEQLQSLISDRTEITFERERINKLRQEAESENQAITRLQYDLEVERKALSMARSWAEEEAKRVREHGKALEEARDRWKKHGIQVVVDSDLQDDESAGVTWTNAGKESTVDETVNRAETLVDKLKEMAESIKGKSKAVIELIILKINSIIMILKEKASCAAKQVKEFQSTATSKASESLQEFQSSANGYSTVIKEGATRIAGECKEGVEKITQKFKST
ncbi:hypothetical protein C5167_048040 [Papaver somniferum]|uniref:SLH domain-containing protein n=1 Tax=Papaver somniferum TaxID=3469 RepID=A0A4Y7KKF4_PAPSO|nr:uncharacterized protein LOC113304248 isoform X1 [Papaver somniferum]RZC72568.1 hypothetical protein C5167_048040 [Papaver somniferum]